MLQAARSAKPDAQKTFYGITWRGCSLLTSISLVVAGCGPSGPSIAPVSGKVVLGGKPLTEGTVCFVSASGYVASASLGPDGAFRLVSQYGKGIPLGDYRVTITPCANKVSLPMPPENVKPTQASHIPTEYQFSHSSSLRAAVRMDRHVFTFDLQAPEDVARE